MADQVLGRGIIYFDPYVSASNQTLTGEIDLGNAPEFTISIETNTLDHYSSREAVRTKDQAVELEVNRSGSFTLDSITATVIALFVGGAESSVSQASATDTTTTIATATGGRWYKMGATSGNPTGVRGITGVTISGATLTTDYLVDGDEGRIYIVPGGGLAGDTNVVVTYDVPAKSIPRVASSNSAVKVGALRFVSDNTVGANRNWYMPYVKLTANGDMTMIGEDWAQAGFNLEILQLNDSTAAIYCDGVPV